MNNSHEFPRESGPQIPDTKEVASLLKEQPLSPEAIEKYTAWQNAKKEESNSQPEDCRTLYFHVEVISMLVIEFLDDLA